ncbi:MAG: tRNA (adenosine(37)-N6)-threonylcarbamoyltransferase complex transferase subunit TsaD [Clostridia bacterium]|nr:tRNA (adenosine(37)-N6)-threonylcarbamoyltransferase complex transferase subunit TsaD [Clostridia bacterium]
MKILGIETSCDETAAAIVEDGRKIISSSVVTQIEVHKLYGGVVPEIASRMHTESLNAVCKKALSEADLNYSDIDAVAVTYAPGLIGAVLTGVCFAKGLAYSLEKPLIPVHHIRGHISVLYTEFKELTPPFLAICASGGHTSIILVKSYTEFEHIGRTRDDAAGESFDKAARVLGLSYPGGPEIDKLAKAGNERAYKIPIVSFEENPFDFSFSGVKTFVINLAHSASQRGEEINREDLAASFNYTVAKTLGDKLISAAKHYKIDKIAAVGGVSANDRLRAYLKEQADKNGLSLYIPPKKLSGDNGVMPAAQGYFEYLSGNTAGLDLNGYATMEI